MQLRKISAHAIREILYIDCATMRISVRIPRQKVTGAAQLVMTDFIYDQQ